MDPTKARAKEETIALSSELLRKLRAVGGLSNNDLWQLYSDRARPDLFPDERALVAKIISKLCGANPGMISRQLVLDSWLHRVLGVHLEHADWDPADLPDMNETLDNLLTYEAHRSIDIPIVNLDVEGKPFSLGGVHFLPLPESERNGQLWESVESIIGKGKAAESVVSYARVDAPGDLDQSVSHADQAVETALLLIRGISFPFSVSEAVQIGVVGNVYTAGPRPHRLSKPRENLRIEYPSEWVARLGPGLAPYRLYQDLLRTVSTDDLADINRLVDEHGWEPRIEIPAKIVRGFRWIGEASKPDIVSARLAKLTFALETLVGGEPRDQRLSSIGITALLAERTAFLVADAPDERRQADEAVRRYYGIRSDIVHGRASEISEADLQQFVALIRRTAFALVRKSPTIKTIDELAAWTRAQRYS